MDVQAGLQCAGTQRAMRAAGTVGQVAPVGEREAHQGGFDVA